jgi:hypothetical protein
MFGLEFANITLFSAQIQVLPLNVLLVFYLERGKSYPYGLRLPLAQNGASRAGCLTQIFNHCTSAGSVLFRTQ